MSHADPGPMAGYNSLQDKNLVGYFSNQRMRRHLRRSGLINRRGEIVTESTYRMSMARKEHQRHVRDLMAQAIVHKALDMERHRQSTIKNKLEEIAKVELVRKVRSERGRRGDEDIVPFLSPRAPSGRPNSAHSHRRGNRARPRQRPVTAPTNKSSYNSQNIVYVDADGFPVHRERGSSTRSSVTSGEIDSQNLRELDPRTLNEISLHLRPEDRDGLAPYRVNQVFKPQPPTVAQQRRQRPKPRNKAAPSGIDGQRRKPKGRKKRTLHRKEPAYPHAGQLQTLCDVTVRYRGNNLKIQYEREDPRDEITIYQQHCGGENLMVFEGLAEPGTDLVFTSRRHRGYPFSATFFVNRVQSLRLSACCEYKYTPHSLLGGSKGHFKFIRVDGSSPCYRCMVEAELARRERQRYRGTQTDQADPPPEPTPEWSVIATQTEEEEASKGEYEDDFDEEQGSGSEKGGREEESETSEDEADSRKDEGSSKMSDNDFFDSDAPEGRQQNPRYTDSEFEDDRLKVAHFGGSQGGSRSGSISEQNVESQTNPSDSDQEGRVDTTDDERSEVSTVLSSRIKDDGGRSKVSEGSSPRAQQEAAKESDVDDDDDDASRRSEVTGEVNNNDDAVSTASQVDSQGSINRKDDCSPRSDNKSGDAEKEVPGNAIPVRDEKSEGEMNLTSKEGNRSKLLSEQDDKNDSESDSESELKNVESSDDELSTSARSKSRVSGHNSEDDYRPLSATSSSSDSDTEGEVHASQDLEQSVEGQPSGEVKSNDNRPSGNDSKDGKSPVSKNEEEEKIPTGEAASGSEKETANPEVPTLRPDDAVGGSSGMSEQEAIDSKQGDEISKKEMTEDKIPCGVDSEGNQRPEDDGIGDEEQGGNDGVSSGMSEQETGQPKQEHLKDDGDSLQRTGGDEDSPRSEVLKTEDTFPRKKQSEHGIDKNKEPGENDRQDGGEVTFGGGDINRENSAVGGQSEESTKDKTGEQGDQGLAALSGGRVGGDGTGEPSGGMSPPQENSGGVKDGEMVGENDGAGTGGFNKGTPQKSPQRYEGSQSGTSGEETPRSGRDTEGSDQEPDTKSNSEGSETSSSDVSGTLSPVTVLNLNEKGITSERALKLAATLLKPRYNQVQYLLVRGNPIGDRGLTAIVHSLMKLHQDGPADDGEPGLRLTHLDLGDTQITNKGVNELAELLKLPTRLLNVNLSDNAISRLGWLALAAGVRENSALRTLSVEYTGLGDEGCREICEAAADSQTLTELNLEGNGIGELGGEAILKMLRENERIETVNFERDNNIPAHISQEIKDML